MLPILFDEDFNGRIIRGLRRVAPHLDTLRVPDAGLGDFDDPEVLAWAAEHGRVIVSHDVTTMSAHAWRRLTNHQALAGLILAANALPIGQVIADLRLIAECSVLEEFKDRVLHLPL